MWCFWCCLSALVLHRQTSPYSSWRSHVSGGDTAILSGWEESWRGKARWRMDEWNSSVGLVGTSHKCSEWGILSSFHPTAYCQTCCKGPVQLDTFKYLVVMWVFFFQSLDWKWFCSSGNDVWSDCKRPMIAFGDVCNVNEVLVFQTGGSSSSSWKGSVQAAPIPWGWWYIWWLFHRGTAAGPRTFPQQVSHKIPLTTLPETFIFGWVYLHVQLNNASRKNQFITMMNMNYEQNDTKIVCYLSY